MEEDPFVPHIAITGALVLALVAVGTLVWFVHHIATSINIETVVDAVQQDLCKPSRPIPGRAGGRPSRQSSDGRAFAATGGGYVQALDETA